MQGVCERVTLWKTVRNLGWETLFCKIPGYSIEFQISHLFGNIATYEKPMFQEPHFRNVSPLPKKPSIAQNIHASGHGMFTQHSNLSSKGIKWSPKRKGRCIRAKNSFLLPQETAESSPHFISYQTKAKGRHLHWRTPSESSSTFVRVNRYYSPSLCASNSFLIHNSIYQNHRFYAKLLLRSDSPVQIWKSIFSSLESLFFCYYYFHIIHFSLDETRILSWVPPPSAFFFHSFLFHSLRRKMIRSD